MRKCGLELSPKVWEKRTHEAIFEELKDCSLVISVYSSDVYSLVTWADTQKL